MSDRIVEGLAAEVTALRTQLDEAVRLLRLNHRPHGVVFIPPCTTCDFLRAAALSVEADPTVQDKQ